MQESSRKSAGGLLGLSLVTLLFVGAGCAAKTDVAVNGGVQTPPGQAQGGGEAGEYNNGGNVAPAIGRMPVKQLRATLTALNGSGQSGTAVITEDNGKTTVKVLLNGEPEGADEPSHIHVGSCPNPGAVQWPLTDVIGGDSTTTLDVPLAEMIAKMPISINVHKSGKDLATYEACGDLALPSDQPSGAMLKTDGQAGADVDTRNINAGAAASGSVNGTLNGALNGTMNGTVKVDAGAGATAGAGTVTFKLTAKQFSYDPSEIRVKLGQNVRLQVYDADVPHGFSLPTFNVNEKLTVGQTTTIEFTADQKGTFPFFCNSFCGSGHTGMRGSLIVE